MAIRVSATETNPTHDISLSDGSTTIGLHLCNPQGVRDRRAIRQTSTPRTSLQIQQGDPDYSGYNLPYTPVTQKDWSGGRGQLDFKRDSTKYYDAFHVNTIHGNIQLGPAVTEAQGITGSHTQTTGASMDSEISLPALSFNLNYIYSSRFTADTAYTLRSVEVYLRQTNPDTTLPVYAFVELRADDNPTTTPSTLLAKSATFPVRYNATLEKYVIPLVYSLSNTTNYWIGVGIGSASDESTTIEIGFDTSEPAIDTYGGNGFPDTLIYSDSCIYFKTSSEGSGNVKFFQYRKTELAVLNYDAGGAPRLFMNGLHGFATSNSSNKDRLNTAYSLSGYTATTSNVIKLFKGVGSNDDPSWKYVKSKTATGTNDYFTFDTQWQTTHDTTTEWTLQGNIGWTEITGHGLTAPVTDVCVVGDIIYFAMGDSTVVRKGKCTSGLMNTAANWSWDDEGASTKATFIKYIPGTDGKAKVWLAQATTSNVYKADPVTWSTDLTLTQVNNSTACGNPQSKITNMVAYGNPRIPYIFKEDGFGSIATDVYAEIPNAELASVADENNGRAACVYGVYLFFSLNEGFERYYDQTLDDIGPNRDQGLPTYRQGPIYKAIPYAGGILCSVDAGDDGESAIMFWSSATNGWHEIYRHQGGARIRGLDVQVISGDWYDFLWFAAGHQVFYLPIAINPEKQHGYDYTSHGYLITSWYKTTLGDINKFWRDVLFWVDGSATYDTVTLEYQTDDETDDDAWHCVLDADGNTVSVTPSIGTEVLISQGYDVTAKRIRFKINLKSTDPLFDSSPKVRAYTMDAVTRVPPSKAWSVTFQADDSNVQEGEADYEALDMDGLLAQLETWADSDTQAAPLTMRALVPQHDDKYVFVDAPSVQLREVVLEDGSRVVKAIGTISLYEA